MAKVCKNAKVLASFKIALNDKKLFTSLRPGMLTSVLLKSSRGLFVSATVFVNFIKRCGSGSLVSMMFRLPAEYVQVRMGKSSVYLKGWC